MLAIINGRVVFKDKIGNKVLLIEAGRISDIADRVPEGAELIDAKGLYVAPGFVEMHAHAIKGYDVMDATFQSINGMSKSFIETGVTAFLAATMTMPEEEIAKAIKSVKELSKKTTGARLLGVHMEGPFISPKYKGAQKETYIQRPSMKAFSKLCNGFEKTVKVITIAPEVEGAVEFINEITKGGTVVSMGHTNATYDEAIKGIEAGIKSSTHTFNGMRGFHHREPGALGAVFDSDIFAEFVCDGVHVHFAALRSLLKIKGVEKMILVTDSMRATGLADGVYDLGGQQVFVKNGEAKLADGTIAGSTLTMNRAVFNSVKHLGVTIAEAVSMASHNPAKLFGLSDMGEIKRGNVADFIFFDEDINIKEVYLAGKKVF